MNNKLMYKKIFKIALLVYLVLQIIPSAAMRTKELSNHRLHVIKNYVQWLGEGNTDAVVSLFAEDASTVSSSGQRDSPKHFYETLLQKTISNPHAILINIFPGQLDKNMFAAYFLFEWENLNHQPVQSHFLDLFYFAPNQTHIKTIYIFSNTFKDDIMKSLNQ